MVDALRDIPGFRKVRVVQILGGIGNPTAETHATRLVSRLAQLVHGEAVYLPAPGVVGSAESLSVILSAPFVQTTVRLRKITKQHCKLEIGKDLESKWFVESLQNGGMQPRLISAAERRELGVAKIGNYFDSDLAWGRNSALSRLTNKEDLSQIPTLLADAERQIFQALKKKILLL